MTPQRIKSAMSFDSSRVSSASICSCRLIRSRPHPNVTVLADALPTLGGMVLLAGISAALFDRRPEQVTTFVLLVVGGVSRLLIDSVCRIDGNSIRLTSVQPLVIWIRNRFVRSWVSRTMQRFSAGLGGLSSLKTTHGALRTVDSVSYCSLISED